VYTPKLYLIDERELRKLSSIVSREISKILRDSLASQFTEKTSVLVSGIGNREITPDAIGPLTAEKIEVTRHIKKLDPYLFERIGSCCVSSVSCGVMGDTGMDTFEILKGIVSKTSPDAVIAVDALSAKECKTLGAAIQISDTGIVPGAGVGNRQIEINHGTIGVPVIAIGVPTVVSASTLISDMLIQNGVGSDENIMYNLNCSKNFFVAPKECDLLCRSAATVLSDAINSALTVI
jgi:spore protease